MRSVIFNLFPPPETLQRDVECVRVARYAGTERLEVKTCPNGLPGLVFHMRADGGPAIECLKTPTAEAPFVPIFFLHGQGTEPSVMHFKPGPYTTIQIVLKPYALYSIFGIDASSLSMGMLMPADFGGEQLERQLIAAPTITARIALLEDFLAANLTRTAQRDVQIEKAVAHIQEHIATITVKQLVDVLGMSERQLQKRFARVVGGSPQQYIRVKRINEALRLMTTGEYERLTDVAQALNYYDQSHFVRDIKALSWVTPKSLTQKVSDFNQDVAGASYL